MSSLNREKKHNILAPDKIVELLELYPGKNVIDCTFGVGGHSGAILKASPGVNLHCVDFDRENFSVYGSPFEGKAKLIHDNFANIAEISKSICVKFDSILIDLGFHQEQIFNPAYGLSYMSSQPLNMLVDNTSDGEKTALYYVNHLGEKDLANILFTFGEERYSKRIANKICERRRQCFIRTTGELADIVKESVFSHQNSSCARVFQAIRMYVNKELDNLIQFLRQVSRASSPNCTLVTLSFHSIEDRIIKNFMMNRSLSFNCEEVFKYTSCRSDYISGSTKSQEKLVMKNTSFTNRKSMPFVIRSMKLNAA